MGYVILYLASILVAASLLGASFGLSGRGKEDLDEDVAKAMLTMSFLSPVGIIVGGFSTAALLTADLN